MFMVSSRPETQLRLRSSRLVVVLPKWRTFGVEFILARVKGKRGMFFGLKIWGKDFSVEVKVSLSFDFKHFFLNLSNYLRLWLLS